MRIPTPARWGILALAVAFMAPGCGSDSDPLSTSTDAIGGNNTVDQIDLNQEYGGLAYTDEAPAFGDSGLLGESLTIDQNLMAEDDEDSILEHDPQLRDHPRLKRTMVRIFWGQLDGVPNSTAERPESHLDWSGQLKVTGGIVALKRTILFEPPYDHLLPREDAHTLSWQSYTGPHFDGLLVCVLQRPDSNGVYPEGELIFRTGPYSTTLSLADLDSLELTETVDDLGNAISFEGREVSGRCPAGFLRGVWAKYPDSDGGIFLGLWVNRFGMATGFVRGRWGMNETGEKVFAGKVIGRNGEIRGLLRGNWEAVEDGRGTFSGHWASRFGHIEGQLRGEYRYREELGAGFFRAQWRANCGG